MALSGDIVICGHLCIDIIPGFSTAKRGHEYFRPGTLTIVEAPVIATGGAVSNVGISIHKLGFPARLVARTGKDPLGTLIVERISAMGSKLARDIVSVEGEITSYTVVLNPPGVDRIFLHCPGANDTFAARDVPDQVLENAAILHFGYPPLMKRIFRDGGEGIAALFHRAKKHGAFTSLDMSLPDPDSESGRVDWISFLSRVLPEVDFFMPSIDELAFMMDRSAFDQWKFHDRHAESRFDLNALGILAAKALSLGCRAVLIKLGENGAYLRTSAEGPNGLHGWKAHELYTTVFRIDALAGTTGAGDATIAGLLAAVALNWPAERALTMAVAVGGCCVEAMDATSGIRSWEDTLARIDGGWNRLSLIAPQKGWKLSDDGVWRGPYDVNDAPL